MKRILYTLLILGLTGLTCFGQTRSIVPRADGEGSIGTEAKAWGEGHFDYLKVNDVPISFTVFLTNLLVTNMTYEQTTNVEGLVVGVYDDTVTESVNTFYCIAANSNRFEFESWLGDVATLTVDAVSTNGYLNAPLHYRVQANGACMVIGGSNYWINFINSTNVGFVPSIATGGVYVVEDVRAVELKTSLAGGRFDGVNGPFDALEYSGTRYWQGISTHDGITIYAAVSGGTIYKSVDGGATWTDLPSGTRYWWGISTHDGVTIYAVVYGGVIYKSVDGGATWTDLPSGTRGWQGISTHDGVTIYAVVSGGAIYKSVGQLFNSVFNVPYTVIINQSTNINYSMLDTAISENRSFVYYSLQTATNEWSIYDMTKLPYGWEVNVEATNGVDWKFRDTSNVMVLSGTNELATISMAIESNTLNRQSAYIYSGSLDYDTFTSGKIRFAVTFYNQKSRAPVLQGITTKSLVNPNGYKWVMDEYDVLIDPITHTNSTVKKTSKGTSANVLIEYLRKITE